MMNNGTFVTGCKGRADQFISRGDLVMDLPDKEVQHDTTDHHPSRTCFVDDDGNAPVWIRSKYFQTREEREGGIVVGSVHQISSGDHLDDTDSENECQYALSDEGDDHLHACREAASSLTGKGKERTIRPLLDAADVANGDERLNSRPYKGVTRVRRDTIGPAPADYFAARGESAYSKGYISRATSTQARKVTLTGKGRHRQEGRRNYCLEAKERGVEESPARKAGEGHDLNIYDYMSFTRGIGSRSASSARPWE